MNKGNLKRSPNVDEGVAVLIQGVEEYVDENMKRFNEKKGLRKIPNNLTQNHV